MSSYPPSDEKAPRPPSGDRADDGDEALVLDVEGFEGPLDVLLLLARSQKLDLAKISILDLVEQYLPLWPGRGVCGWNWRRIIW
ncbi:hypothetical protein JCM17846_08990 [Iodidimonas nitroreducens]|uniref:Segregation/condensation protein A n=1 Tax=Iodidimonas nitroreducens TaxID=1236968 RepID=A0A5A7N5F6_9PROT|nr:hypothetical protein [Iodidimonas nitroreducens]GER03217.1 hypothetical protein JCM17846_08990 [Iodidimonas nitroreducens]